MNTITLNTFTGAVTEYDNFPFDSVTPTHAGSAQGMYEFGGDTDAGQPIAARVVMGKTLQSATSKKYVDVIFYAVKGVGQATGVILGEKATYSYNMQLEKNRLSRCKPGRGIRENYMAFGFENQLGRMFELDSVEVLLTPSTTRRTQ
jgi:hypothetical protein